MKILLYLTLIAVSCGSAAVAQKCPKTEFECVVDGEYDFNETNCPMEVCCWNRYRGKCYAKNVGKEAPPEKEPAVVERSLEVGPPPPSPEEEPENEFECVVEGEYNFNETNCPMEVCCWNKAAGICYAKNVWEEPDENEKSEVCGPSPPPPSPSPANNTFGKAEDQQEKVAALVAAEVAERSLGFFPPGVCKPPKQFPLNCVMSPHLPFVFDPPVNIPYCVRIPCSSDKNEQKIYDKNLGKCGRQPGCYFDKELAEFRKYNVPIMPGVPVCHYAIRSAVFLREAMKVKSMMGEWNPYFTSCIIDGEFKKEIANGPPGCALNKLLEIFGIPSKMAGWSTINSRQCGLIDACWFRGKGCFYPVDLGNLIVKSGQKLVFNPREVVFGRPKCQHFRKSTPYDLLRSYHKCLIAGCTVDINILAGYNMKLFEIGNDLSPQDHWQYWDLAKVGKIGAHNLKSIKWPRKPRIIPTSAPTTKSHFSFPQGFPSFPGGISKRSIGGGSPTYPNPGGSVPQSFNCGFLSRVKGGRPCPPSEGIPAPHQPHLYCPYKTVTFPKFTRLKGSVHGCCEINECYLSRTDIRKMHSGPTKYLSQWSLYSPCTVSCGGGTQYRTRVCVSVNDEKCSGPLEDVRKCSTGPCGTWTNWSHWSPCAYCPGVQERTRTCIGGSCPGDESQSRTCPCWKD